MRILLINPPQELTSVLGIGKEFIQKYEPLGLLYIAAVVRKAGYEVSVIDAFAEDLSLNDLKKRILKEDPNIVGITTLTCSGEVIFYLGKWLKKNFSDLLVVLGNIHASIYAKQYLENNCCDIVVHGEAEYTFLKLIKYYNQIYNLNEIPGISFLNSGEVIQTSPKCPVVEDLAGLPFPARDLVNQKLYGLTEISNQFYIGGKNNIAKTMLTSRGCPHRCSFCVVHFNRKPRYNNPKKVVDEMEILEKEYNTSYVYIMDSLFMGNTNRVFSICSEIKKRKLKLRWGCDAHINYITPAVIRAMDSAGCYELSLGIESGVQRLLDTVHKGIKVSKVREVIEIIKKNSSNIFIEGLFILGLPGEKYEDSLKTIRFAKTLPINMAQFSILMPYPGSQLFSELAENDEIDTGLREDGSINPSVWRRYASYIFFTDIEPIWVTPTLTSAKLRKLQKKAFREFYLRPPQIIWHLKRINVKNIFKVVKIIFRGFF